MSITHHVMRIVQLADQRHDFGFVQLMPDRDRMFGRRRDPIRQGVIEIGVHGRHLEAAHRQAAEDKALTSVVLPAPPFVVATVMMLTMNPAS